MRRQDYENLMKDCPRCGSRAKIIKMIEWDSLDVDYYPQCQECKLTTLDIFPTENLAVNAWNALEEMK